MIFIGSPLHERQNHAGAMYQKIIYKSPFKYSCQTDDHHSTKLFFAIVNGVLTNETLLYGSKTFNGYK